MNSLLRCLLIFFLTCQFQACKSKKIYAMGTRIDEKPLLDVAKKFDGKKIPYIAKQITCIGSIDARVVDKNDCRTCYPEYEVYVFWSEDGKSFVQKFDDCSEFRPIEISTFHPDIFLQKYTATIQQEEVKTYQMGENMYSSTSHTCDDHYVVYDGKDKYKKSFDTYNLEGEGENLNYETNHSLEIVKMSKILTGIIVAIEPKKEFIRIKRTCKKK